MSQPTTESTAVAIQAPLPTDNIVEVRILGDETRKPAAYWTNQPHPAVPSARVVVWFDVGYVYDYCDYDRARARAVRVAGQ